MPAKIAISWDWATNWLKARLSPYIKDYIDDPQELKYRTNELIEDEVMKIYNQSEYPEKKIILSSLKELYESLQDIDDEDWNQLIEYIAPPQTQTITSQPTFNQILESVEPRQQMSMEDVDESTEQLEIEPIARRPVDTLMIRHPKNKTEFSAGPGKKVFNQDKKDTGIIDTIYEDTVVVKDEETGQLKEWPITDKFWESQ